MKSRGKHCGARPASEHDAAASATAPRALLVISDRAYRSALRAQLENRGLKVALTSGWESAASLLATSRMDIVFVEIAGPGDPRMYLPRIARPRAPAPAYVAVVSVEGDVWLEAQARTHGYSFLALGVEARRLARAAHRIIARVREQMN